MTPKTTPDTASTSSAEDPKDTDRRYAVIIVDEDGQLHLLHRRDWKKYKMPDGLAAAKGAVQSLTDFGAYLSFVPDVGVGYGTACTVVNLKAILRNNPAPKKDDAG